MDVVLALPAYNEERSLGPLLSSFCAQMQASGYSSRIVIVDDGSRDATAEVIREWAGRAAVRAVRHEENEGLGTTIRDALRHAVAVAGEDDVIVTMDADNTHDPAQIPMMIERLRAGSEVVIASRFQPGAQVFGVNPYRNALSGGARMLFRFACPVPGVRDYTCGFRAYGARALARAMEHYGDSLVSERSFACMAEILLKLARFGLRIAEVPIVLRYDRRESPSKMKAWPTIAGTLRLAARTRFSS
jgi:dolichol-phosphate mannosyltransferase